MPLTDFIKNKWKTGRAAGAQDAAGAAEDALKVDISPGARYLKDRLAPSAMTVKSDSIDVPGEFLVRTWWVEDLPRQVAYGLLSDLYDFPARIQISQLVVPMDVREVRESLKQQRTTLLSGQMLRAKRGQITDYDQLDRIASAEQQAMEIQIKKTPPLKLFWTIGVFAHTEEDLEELSKRLEELLGHAEIRAHRAIFRQEQGLHSLLPLGINTLGDWRNVDVPAMGQMFPFTHSSLIEASGIPYGIDRTTGSWVIADDFQKNNPNTIIAGDMGSGKSMFLKTRITWFALSGGRVFCLDLEGEFDGLADALGGVYLDFGLGQSTHHLNVIGINVRSKNGYIEGMEDLIGWITLAVNGMDPAEKNEVIDAWQRMMADAGIFQDEPDTWAKPMPRLSDMYAILMSEGNAAAKSVGDRLKQYAVGIYADAFNVRTNINIRDNLVIFNLRDVRDPLMKALRMRQIFSFVWGSVLTELRPTWVVVDEAWNWLQHPQAAKDLEEIARRFRKRYGALHLATQHIADFSHSSSAAVIRDTAGVTLIFRQKSAEAAAAAGHLFQLNNVETDELITQGVGEGLLLIKGRRIPIYMPILPDLMPYFTTNPKDREALNQQ